MTRQEEKQIGLRMLREDLRNRLAVEVKKHNTHLKNHDDAGMRRSTRVIDFLICELDSTIVEIEGCCCDCKTV